MRVHVENLNSICLYCSNKTECRRVQLLSYLGETFDSKLCKMNRLAACDNCTSSVSIFNCCSTFGLFLTLIYFQESFERKDVTDEATQIIKCVETLLKSTGKQKWSINHLTDILRGIFYDIFLRYILN